MSLTISQITNGGGFPKAAELIEITGTHALEASDRAIFNHLLQTAHDSGRRSDGHRLDMRAMTDCAKAYAGFVELR
jgi:hypothetical protein